MPYEVKSGGHAYNLNVSSTLGVQIAMSKFNNISYDAEQNTVTLGTGLTWDQVYDALDPLSVNVVGGRMNGVGEWIQLPSRYEVFTLTEIFPWTRRRRVESRWRIFVENQPIRVDD